MDAQTKLVDRNCRRAEIEAQMAQAKAQAAVALKAAR
jgi:hypothetical protein